MVIRDVKNREAMTLMGNSSPAQQTIPHKSHTSRDFNVSSLPLPRTHALSRRGCKPREKGSVVLGQQTIPQKNHLSDAIFIKNY